MHDVLQYASRDPVHRRWNHNELTFSMIYAYTENFILPFSHDEVVHGKRSMLDKLPGDEWQKRATLRMLFAYMFVHPGRSCCSWGPSSGSGASGTTTRRSTGTCWTSPGTRGCSASSRISIASTATSPALHQRDHQPDGFRWIDCSDNENSVVSVLRMAADPADHLVGRLQLHARAPARLYRRRAGGGFYREVLNTDSRLYGGSGVGNLGGLHAMPAQRRTAIDQSLAADRAPARRRAARACRDPDAPVPARRDE